MQISTVTQLADHLRGNNPAWSHHVFADGSVVSVRRGTAGRPATLSTGPGWSPMSQQIVPLTTAYFTVHPGNWSVTVPTVIVGSAS